MYKNQKNIHNPEYAIKLSAQRRRIQLLRPLVLFKNGINFSFHLQALTSSEVVLLSLVVVDPIEPKKVLVHVKLGNIRQFELCMFLIGRFGQ